MNAEYSNINSYDSIQVHGGSGYMLEYACQRLYRDASANAELFGKSAKVYLNLAEAEVMKHSNFIMGMTADQIADYKA